MSRRASGLRAWILQRLSALYLALYASYLLAWFATNPPQDHARWLAWVSDPLNGTGLTLFFGVLLLHAWIGLRDVLMDYVPTFALRLTLPALTGLGLVACGLWALRIILVPLII